VPSLSRPVFVLISFENLVILTMDGADLQYHVALDKEVRRDPSGKRTVPSRER